MQLRPQGILRKNWSVWLCWALVVIVPLLLYLPTIAHEFVVWDDPPHISKNPFFSPVSFQNLLQFWKEPYSGLYIPMSYTVWGIFAALAGRPAPDAHGSMLLAWPFHLANVLIHALNTWLVFQILLCALRSRSQAPIKKIYQGACLGALLFAVHPLQVESVCWATALKDLLYSCFAFLGIWQFALWARATRKEQLTDDLALPFEKRNEPQFHYHASCVGIALSMLSKPAAVTVPFAALAIVLWIRPRLSFQELVQRFIPWALASLPLSFLAKYLQPDENLNFVTPIWARPFVAADALAFYLFKTLIPWRLGPDYGRSPEVLLDSKVHYLSCLIPLALTWLAWKRRQTIPGWTAWFAFAAGLLPVSGLVAFSFQNYSTVADHYVYFAFFGIALFAAWGAQYIERRGALAAAGALLIVLASLSVVQSRLWKNTATLMTHAIHINPKSFMAYNNMGLYLSELGQLEEGLKNYEIAAGIVNRPPPIVYNLANVYAKMKRYPDAVRLFQEALEKYPPYADAHNNLGTTYALMNDQTKALEHFEAAVKINPTMIEAQLNLARALARRNELDQSFEHFLAAQNTSQNSWDVRETLERKTKARLDLAHYLIELGKEKAAFAQFQEALKSTSAKAKVLFEMANLHLDNGRLSEARSLLEQALTFEPRNSFVHNNLGAVLARMDDLKGAATHFQAAIELEPLSPDAHTNLGRVAMLTGNRELGISLLRRALEIAPGFGPAESELQQALRREPAQAPAQRKKPDHSSPRTKSSAKAHESIQRP